MDGKNKNIVQETPFAGSVWPKYPISATTASTSASASANPFSFLSPSNLPISPTSFNYAGEKPYFMNQGVAAGSSVGGSSSKTKPSFFSGLESYQNPFHPLAEKLILGAPANIVVGRAVRGHGDLIKEQNMDPKKLRRVISNRLSAQRSRVRRLQHVSYMEKKVESLQALVAVLSSQIKLQKDKQLLLRIEEKYLQNLISECANRRVMVDAEIEEKRAELIRLRALHLTPHDQQMQSENMAVWEHELPIEEMLENYIAEEVNRLNQLNLDQENPEHMMLPGWEASGGDFTTVFLDQAGPELLQNPFPNHPQEQQFGSFSSGFGELEKIFNFNPGNDSRTN
ncbi:hypothetical protein F3Y22_tig00110300pilonHSYRG00051 [Hibiscus syriacus]|uniref:BZIP domain-containing protein n=1 Tax=Hibiscus syriacus TaxID=106335 RepID=A0A6A3B3T3_HIBSY|nr:hypothetical protein F3Y22_tig00110300pilonHSYRG00051 [Hibiscus syriacus]